MVRIVSLVVSFVLLIGAGYGIWWAFSSPTEVEKRITLMNYQHDGEFDHQVYAKSDILSQSNRNEPESPRHIFFNKLIESVDVIFNYKFLYNEPVTDLTESVKISAIIENTGMWRHEIVLVPETEKTGDFSISFPFDAEQFQTVADNIGTEIGIRNFSPDITLKATVHTKARTEFGFLDSNFIQTTKVRLDKNILEWDRNLSTSERGSYFGSRYEHQGIFDYKIRLGPNILYGAPITIKAQTPPPDPPVTLSRSTSYSTANIDDLDLIFSYMFKSTKPVNRISEEVKVTAELADPGNWSENYLLLPNRKQNDDFSITFPLDLQFFYDEIEKKQNELRLFSNSHRLNINAEVHTVAESEFGPIDEYFNESLSLNLSSSTVAWPSDISKSQSGSITENRIVSQPGLQVQRYLMIAAISVAVLLFLFVVWNYIQVIPWEPTRAEREIKQARNKYKKVIFDVQELPDKGTAEIVELGSLEGLVNTADALLKPALHEANAHKHTYCVIDGTTRYEYTIQTDFVE